MTINSEAEEYAKLEAAFEAETTASKQEQTLKAVEPEEPAAESPAIEVDDTTEEIEDTSSYSEIEKEAIKKGWNPKGKRDAQTYLEFGEVIDKLMAASEENKKYRETVKIMIDKFQGKEKRAYERAVQELEAKRIAAINEADVDQVYKIEQELNNVRQEIQSLPDVNTEAADHDRKVAEEFAARNKAWYNNDSLENMRMMQDAQLEDQRLAALYPNLSFAERLQAVEQTIRKHYASHAVFSNARREHAVASVTSTEQKREHKKKVTLTKQQAEMLAFMQRADKNYTAEQYLKDIGGE